MRRRLGSGRCAQGQKMRAPCQFHILRLRMRECGLQQVRCALPGEERAANAGVWNRSGVEEGRGNLVGLRQLEHARQKETAAWRRSCGPRQRPQRRCPAGCWGSIAGRARSLASARHWRSCWQPPGAVICAPGVRWLEFAGFAASSRPGSSARALKTRSPGRDFQRG
ncbi:hypothetical protein CERSUDRAFT_119472 [Gelatoporia subvermispora B]|uniref:Uncharacterized protein n=1 Tax=Ceriporiopsis subvermispora (strain B) TaxID=914234 RepID=M2QYQ0_CERS8|nr:hypothetical protein CERSUDRAFT_119472 [Gelatoporia subvermispora B]